MKKLIEIDLVDLNLKAKNKNEAIVALAEHLEKADRLNDKEEYVKCVLAREELSTTGIGFGVAIPHGKTDAVKVPSLCFGRCTEKLDWQSLDENSVESIFLIAVPEEAAKDEHLRILAALARKLMSEEFREELSRIQDKEQIIKLLDELLNN
ncbi:PTS transporter subunit EIIA [Clostridium sp. P21]|uniref:PTS transporter subunit EIIA n=1 Tax=Clostridium muellerianum TaxID=2716538 RepID=A0A7Y0HS62_9CLOT|nr:fructose PTS transporter subunit IIA [Clostridium muellerianum]NMM65911.1 PTS transporter subunit EIIA [Clostridium muellerianum]